jgi:membrane associated rhomboid family serine protease
MNTITPLVRAIIVINVIVFILQQFLKNVSSIEIEGENIILSLTDIIALWDMKTPLFKPFQFFTYMFAHSPSNYFHLIFNMMALASFGPGLESYWGDKKFLIFYLFTGIGAGVIYATINYFLFPFDGGSMVGASGALYGILMAYGLLFPNVESVMLLIPFPIKAKYLVFIIGGITYLMDRTGKVAHLAHFGGAFMGFVLITYWRRQGRW